MPLLGFRMEEVREIADTHDLIEEMDKWGALVMRKTERRVKYNIENA